VKTTCLLWVVAFCLLNPVMFWAQQSESGLSSSASAYQPASTNVPKLIKFSGVVKDLLGKPLTGPVEINFAIYKEQGEGLPIWQETQVLQLDEQGRYSVLLGAMQPEGLPMELFTTGEARWLEVQVAGAEPQPRTLLVSVPYALKAADAESLGGKPASAYLLSQSAEGSAQAGPQTGSKTAPAAAAGKPTTTTAGVNVTPLVAGTGTMNYLAKWTDNSGTLGNAVLFDNGTNVGIGTTAPARALEVYSATSNLGKIRLTETSTTVGAYSGLEFYGRGGVATTFAGGLFREQNTGAVSLWTGNSGSAPKLVILDAGNVGIGTTTPGTLSGGTFGTVGLHVKGNGGSKYIVVDDSNRVGFLMQDSSQAANNRLWGVANQFSKFTISAYSDAGSPTNHVTVTRSGNVGIGTAVPAAKLDVAGAIHSSGTVTATSFSGSGAGLTNLSAANIGSGTANISITGNAATATTAASATTAGTAANVSCSGCIDSGKIADRTLNTIDLASNSVTGNEIAGASIVDYHLAADANISPSKLAPAARTRGINYIAGCDSCAPLADDDDQNRFYVNVVGSMTFNLVACYSDAGSPIINIQRDDGTPANVLASDLTCSPTGGSPVAFAPGENTLNLNEGLNFVMVSAGGVAKRITVVIKATLN
jgi:hypothetical protein